MKMAMAHTSMAAWLAHDKYLKSIFFNRSESENSLHERK